MPTPPGHLAVSVIGYHAPDDIATFCESLYASDPQVPYGVLVSEVESNGEWEEGTERCVDTLATQALYAGMSRFLTNVGYARACNDAAIWHDTTSAITGHTPPHTFAFFNADTEIRSGVLESCVELLHSDPTIAVVGPRQVDRKGRLTHAGVVGTSERPAHRGWQEPATDWRYVDVVDCVTVSGSAYFVKDSVFHEMATCPLYRAADPTSVGAFLQTPHYFEETWVSYHVRAHGYRVVYNGAATMVHQWQGSTPKNGTWAQDRFRESQAIFRSACDSHGISHN